MLTLSSVFVAIMCFNLSLTQNENGQQDIDLSALSQQVMAQSEGGICVFEACVVTPFFRCISCPVTGDCGGELCVEIKPATRLM